MDKFEKRAIKLANLHKNQPPVVDGSGPIDCACVIHGDAYDWIYVEKLYSMLNRHITPGIRLHVYTEASRPVPSPMIKHVLEDWGIGGPKKSWWYKMQLFNSQHHSGPLLYFDLDVVITQNIDWIWQQSLRYFWTVRDFKYLWRPTDYTINSSIMWWNTLQYHSVWTAFKNQNLDKILSSYHGDQNYLSASIDGSMRRYFNVDCIQSYRWQCFNGGYDFKNRIYRDPNTPITIAPNTGVIVFHGKPKPDQVHEPVILQHWR
jgi:hypothetical protein